jgi:hypothetical protein
MMAAQALWVASRGNSRTELRTDHPEDALRDSSSRSSKGTRPSPIGTLPQLLPEN